MKVPENIVKEFKKLSFSLEEDDRLFEELKAKTKSEFWSSLDWIVQQKGIYRTMESENIAFLLDRLDEFLEQFTECIRNYEINGIKASDSLQNKLSAEEGIIKILKFQAKLIKKDQYRFLFRQLDRILEILTWSDNLSVKRRSLYVLLLVVVAEEGSLRLELSYLKQYQLDQLSFFIRYYILHVNSFNSSYSELSELFRFDDPLFYKLEMVNNPIYKKKTILESDGIKDQTNENDQEDCLIEQENTAHQIDENAKNNLNSNIQTDLKIQESQPINDSEVLTEELQRQFILNKDINWQALLKNASQFEFFDNSINTKTFTSLSTKPILQKISSDQLIKLTLSYDDSLTLFANAKKIFKDQTGGELHESICLFQGLKERLIIFRELANIASRIEIAKIFLLTIQILSFLMKSSKKHMQSIITEQQLAFEKFQKTFPKQVTELIHLKLNPQLQADVIRFMLTIIKEHSQLRKGTEDYLAKQSDSLIYKIYTDCSNLELTIDEKNQDQNQMESEETSHNRYKITSKGSTVQEDTLINSKFIDNALKFVNTILKYPDNQGIQEVTPFAMNFVRTPWKCEYIPYNLRQLQKALNSLALMVQHDEIQREHKIMTKILEKIEYYLEVIPKYQWLDGKWVAINIKDYDIFLGVLLEIVNSIFEAGHKRLRRIAPQLAKSLVELPKFFGLLGNAIDRLKDGYPSDSNNSNDPNTSEIENTNLLSEKKKDQNNILLIQAVHLLSNINKENPSLIEKLIEENIIDKTLIALQVVPLPHNTKSLSHIIYFLYHVSLKEQGRNLIMSSGLLEKIMDIFVKDEYSEELYAFTLNSVTEALHNYYNNIKEIVPIIQSKLKTLLVRLQEKCATFTENVEEYLSRKATKEQQPEINIKYRQILCYQVVNVCKVFEKLTTGIDNVYPDVKNEHASQCLHSYIEILQFPFLFLMPQRTTHKTPFFSVKTTCKAIYSKLGDKSEKEKIWIIQVLQQAMIKLKNLLGQPIQNIKDLNLELVSELQNKDFNTAIQINKDKQLYHQVKIYQQLQFLDAMINTFRSLRINSSMNEITQFFSQISTLFTLTFNQRFKEQTFYVKQRINYLNEQADKIKNNYITKQECSKQEEIHLEQENKEFRLYFKDNILSSKNHVNHYSYQNIIFHTILKLVYQNYTSSDDFEQLQPNHADVQSLIALSIDNIQLSSIDQKIIEAYDFQTLEHVSALAGTLVMLTQILQIFMKDAKLVNFLILSNLQKDGSFAKIVELAKRFSNVWQQNEPKSLLKNKENEQALIDIGMSKESAAQFRKFENLLPSCIDQCLETINSRLESFFRMTSLQITISLNFKKEIKETAKESVRQSVFAWHLEQIKQQQCVLKDIKLPSKNKYFSSLIDFLITNIELMLLPRFRYMKKIQENDKQDEYLIQYLKGLFPDNSREFFIHAIEEQRKDKVGFGTDMKQILSSYILDNQEKIQQSMEAAKKNEENIINDQNKGEIASIKNLEKIGKDEFYVSVKQEAEEMCCFLLRELFCYKNHSDQILALLVRKQQTQIEEIKKKITRIKMIQALEQKRQNTSATMEVEENTENKSQSKKQDSNSSSQQSGEERQQSSSRQMQQQSLWRQMEGDPRPQFGWPRPRTAIRNSPLYDIINSFSTSSRGRRGDFMSSQRDGASQQQNPSSQSKTNTVSKSEQLDILKGELEKLSDDVLVNMFKKTQSTHTQNAYVVFATVSLLSGKITKSAPKFRNPFQADKEVITKLRNNELLRIPSRLDAHSGVFKLELINSLFPFIEKFGFYQYQDVQAICQEKSSTVHQSLAGTKPFTITLLDSEKLELQWREGTQSYEIGLKFLRMARSFINQGFELFCSPKKGEDKESSKLNSYEALSKLVKNVCHIIQIVNQNNATYLEKIKDELAKEDSNEEKSKKGQNQNNKSQNELVQSLDSKQEGTESKQMTDPIEVKDNIKTSKNKKKKRKGNNNNNNPSKNKSTNTLLDEDDNKKKAKKANLRLQIAKAEEFKKESISFFADLLKQTNELYEYYDQSLINLAVLFFILDSIKDFGESDIKMLHQFISEKGVVELLKIRLPCEKSEQIVEKLNIFLSAVSQDRIMALANYESKIKYFFYEKCLQKQTTMYNIKDTSPTNNKKSAKKDKIGNEFATNSSEIYNVNSTQQPVLVSSSSAPARNSSKFTQIQAQKINKLVASQSEELKQENQQKSVTEKPQPLQMSLEQFLERFVYFSTQKLPLFEEVLDKICEKKIIMMPQKSKSQSSKGSNKRQQYQSKKPQKQEESEQVSTPAGSVNLPETVDNNQPTKKAIKKGDKKSKSNTQSKNKKQPSPELKGQSFLVLRDGIDLDVFNLLPKENFMAYALKSDGNSKETPIAPGVYNQQINFIAPSHIYDTLNAILESTVTQFTQQILANYEAIHEKSQNNGKQKNNEQHAKSKQNESQLFGSVLLTKVIQVIARQQPILIPQIVRFRCSKIVKKIISGHPLESVFNKQLGNHFHFLKFITKCANYFSIASVKGLIFELCLDKQILYRNSHQMSAKLQSQQSAMSLNNPSVTQNLVIPFGAEIRKKVLGEIYSSVEHEINNAFESPPTIHLLMSNILLHISLLQIREAAKLSLKNFSLDFTFEGLVQHQQIQQQEGYNFARLYGEIFKRIDLSKMSQSQSLVVFVTAILEMLYILNYYFILYPTGISSSKQEFKKKQDDFFSRFVQGQIINEQLQKHIKQYAGVVNNNLIEVLPSAPNDPFGAPQPSRREQLSDFMAANQMGLFGGRNSLGSSDPLAVLNRLIDRQGMERTQNPYAQLAEQRAGEHDLGGIDSFANHLRRNQQGRFLSLASSNAWRSQINGENGRRGGIRGLDDNADIAGNGRGADDDIEHTLMGRLGTEDNGDEDDDDDDDQLEGIFDEDSGDEEDEDDEEEDEQEEDDDDNDDEEEEDEEEDDDEEEDEEVEGEDDEDEFEDEDDNEEDEIRRVNESQRIQREQQRSRNSNQVRIENNNTNNPQSNFDNQRAGAETVVPSGVTLNQNENNNSNINNSQGFENEDNQIFEYERFDEGNQEYLDDEEESEEQDNGDDEPGQARIQIFLDIVEDPTNPGDDGQDSQAAEAQEDIVDIEPDNLIQDEGSYFNQDWEDYSSEDELSENGEEPEGEDYFEDAEEDPSAEQEIDVRDREDDDDFSENNSQDRGDVEDENQEEEEGLGHNGLMSEEEENVWNDCDLSEEEGDQFGEDIEDEGDLEDDDVEGQQFTINLEDFVERNQDENDADDDEEDDDDDNDEERQRGEVEMEVENDNISSIQQNQNQEQPSHTWDIGFDDDSGELLNYMIPGGNSLISKKSQNQVNQLKQPLNQDYDVKSSVTMREITEFTNIQMCQCVKDSFDRCIQQISVFYLGTSIITSYSTSLKEIQKEVAALEANSPGSLLSTIQDGQLASDQQVRNVKNEKPTNRQTQNSLLRKTVYIALLIYLKHQNFDSQYCTLKKPHRYFPVHSGGLFAGNEPPGSPTAGSSSQLNFTQLRYTPYMAGGERRAAASSQHPLQNNYSRHSRSRLNLRMPQFMNPPGFYGSSTNSSNPNRQPNEQILESEIQGSSLNELISTVQTTMAARNPSHPLAAQFLRGSASQFMSNFRGSFGMSSLGGLNAPSLFASQRQIQPPGFISYPLYNPLQTNRFSQNQLSQLLEYQNNNRAFQLNNPIDITHQFTFPPILEIPGDTQEDLNPAPQVQPPTVRQIAEVSIQTNSQTLQQARNILQNTESTNNNTNNATSSERLNQVSTDLTQERIDRIVSRLNSLAPLIVSQLQRTNISTQNSSEGGRDVPTPHWMLEETVPESFERTTQRNQEQNVSGQNPIEGQSTTVQQDIVLPTDLNELNMQQRAQEGIGAEQQQEQSQIMPDSVQNDNNNNNNNNNNSNSQIPQTAQISAASVIVLSRFNLDASFLTRNGLDFQYFDELPEDIKEELIISYMQYPDANAQVAQVQDPPVDVAQVSNQFDPSFFEIEREQQQPTDNAAPAPVQNSELVIEALPAPSTTTVAANTVTNTTTADAAPPSLINHANVEFVNSADVNLRAEILVQSEDEFLRTLTPEMQEEAQRLRQESGRANNDMNILDELRAFNTRAQNALGARAQNALGIRANQARGAEAASQQQQQDEVNEMFRTENNKLQKKQIRLIDDWIVKDKYIYKKLLDTDDKFIEAILRLVYYGGKSSNVFPLQLLELICKNPLVEEKVFDALMFVLINPNMPEIKNCQKTQETVNSNQQSENGISVKNSECFDFPLLNTYHRNSKEMDYKKVYHEVSLKILRIIQKLTLKKVVFFIEKDNNATPDKENTQIQSIRVLQKIASELASKQQLKGFTLPFFQFIYLLTLDPFRSNYEHLNFLLCSIQNITKKLFQFHSGKQEEEEEEGRKLSMKQSIQNARDYAGLNQKQLPSVFSKDASFFLHGEVITWICSIFSSDQLNDLLIRKLSLIINQLCYDKNNLDMFITELRNIIKIFSIQINKRIQKCLKAIKSLVTSADDFSANLKMHLSALEFSIQGERKIQNIFQIIYELFEKSFFQLEETDKKKESENDKDIEESKQQEIPETRNKSSTAFSDGKGSISKKAPKNSKELERLEAIKKEMRSKFAEIITNQNFNDLWIHCAELFAFIGKYDQNNLSSYNGIIEKLQPVMESYFIIFRILHDEDFEFIKKAQSVAQKNNIITHTKMSSLADDDQIVSINSANPEDAQVISFDILKLNLQKIEIEKIFEFICEQCKAVINQMIRQNLKQKKTQGNRRINDVLQKDPFEIIFKRFPTLIDFENKKNYFKYEMAHFKSTIASSHARRRKIKVRRKHIFEDSFSQIDKMKPEELKQKFIIEFDGEEGIDAGGLIREWFVILSKAVFNPDYLLFKPSSSGNTYQPNPASYLNEPHLQYFKFVGRIVGKALFEGHLLDAYFTRSFYKHILGQPLTYHDIEDQDYEFYKSLKWIIENDITSFTDLTFCYQENQFDQIQTIELKPNGKHITVTEENKQEYVKLICYAKMAKSIKEQIEHFLDGFHELIPPYLVRIFDSHELELMISGLPDIDIFDLKENTEYQNFRPNSKIIEWLWEILEEFDSSQKASFIQFVTGTSKVPVEGFRGLRGISGLQKFQIHKNYDANKLPVAHTCFNQLDIPEYQTKDILKKKLLLAISEGKEGFGFA